jgi:FkbM family methyltransferase
MKILVKFILDLFDITTEIKIKKFFKKIFLNKINIIIDVGSHKGEYILNIIKNFHYNKIYCFEPNPKIFNILKKKISKQQNIELNNIGVGNIEGSEILNENLESSSTSINQLNTSSKYFKKKYFFLNPFQNKSITKPIKIKITTLGNFIETQDIKSIDLLKIDTEGYELKVIEGLGKEIKKIKYIHFEHHFDDMIIKNYNLSNIHDYLKKNNFKKIFKVKMKFRKSFEYIYENENDIS